MKYCFMCQKKDVTKNAKIFHFWQEELQARVTGMQSSVTDAYITLKILYNMLQK